MAEGMRYAGAKARLLFSLIRHDFVAIVRYANSG